MNPYLGKNNHPHVVVEVFIEAWHKADCMIDTGFSSGISLPEKMLKDKKIKPVAYQEFELADGSRITLPIYRVKVRYKTSQKEILLIGTKSSEGLVGMEFLTGFVLNLDLKKNAVSLQ